MLLLHKCYNTEKQRQSTRIKRKVFTLSITMQLLPISFSLLSSLNEKEKKKRGVINKQAALYAPL